MLLKDWIRKRTLAFLGLSKYDGTPNDDRLTFVNDRELIVKNKIDEYNLWYEGDSDELLNFYTQQNTVDYNYEPFYSRNKRSYFWSISSTEDDVKRTHSGQPRNIIDTLVSIMGQPDIKGGNPQLEENNAVNKNLQKIIEENDFHNLCQQEQEPMTMVEGWGCYKINWDKDISDYPIFAYYRAKNVDFIYKSNRIMGIIFKDYYTEGKKRYLVTETRRIEKKTLKVEKEIFEICGGVSGGGEEVLKKINFKDLEYFQDVEPNVEITNFNKLLAVPCIYFKDTSGNMQGRSLFCGKIDLFDDLDQCLSQSSNAVRKSTPVEYFDTNFLERDERTGLPVAPKAYDRKFVMFKGSKTVDGGSMSSTPVQVTQPNLNLEQYSTEAMNILLQIVNGIISPATLGIDIAKKDNADAQREKEKITTFTRKTLTDCQMKILKSLFSQALCAKELMDKGQITNKEYEISIVYPEFADDSFENKITVLGDQLDKGNLSYDMYLKKLYGNKLSSTEYKAEKQFLEERHKQDEGEQGEDDEFDLQENDSQNNPFETGMAEAFQKQNLAPGKN